MKRLPNRTPIRIAIYDLDKTITRRPTFTPFLLYTLATRHRWRSILLPVVALTLLLYAVRLIDRARLKELNHRLLIGRSLPAGPAATLAARFADRTLANNLLPDALAQIAHDRADGRRLVLATASYDIYVRAIADRLGFDGVVATTIARGRDGAVLARIDGENCYGAAKRRKVEAWLATEGLVRDDCDIIFYSDHASDAPMFALADTPVAVNAHAPLRALAAASGWRIVDWVSGAR